MNDEVVETEGSAEAPICGGRLRAVRRDNDISVQDIAKELHLDESKVRALEENNFELLGAPVFAKGHMRKYAELVGVPIEDILDDYYQLNRSAGAPPVVGPKHRQPLDYSFLPALVAGMLAAAIIAAGLYWWFTREPAIDLDEALEPSSLAPFVAEQPSQEVLDDTQDSSGDDEIAVTSDRIDADPESDVSEVVQRSVDDESVDEEPTATEIPAEDRIASDLPQVEVTMAFSGECWTEASDASGRRLFYDLGSPGRMVTISGDAPLRIVFGDADNVQIQVEGRDYTIPASARSGRLARLTIPRP